MQTIAVLGMGLTSVLAQVLVLRRLLTVFSGNELDIGITLALWLLAVGAGSWYGSRFTSGRAFAYSFFILALLVQTAVLSIDLIRPVFGLLPGEIISLPITVLSTLAVLAPLCFTVGLQFPLAVRQLEGNAGRTYGLEAAGAFAGGLLFTFVLAERVEASLLAACLGALNIVLMVALLRRKRRLVLLLIPVLLFLAGERIIGSAPEEDLELVRRVDSRYGEIAVYRSEGQESLFSSGKFDFSYPDPETEELRAHVPATLHPNPLRVLVIGGSPAVAREFLKYPVAAVELVEIDPRMIDLSFSILQQEDRDALRNNRFTVHAADAREFVRSQSGRYDLAVLNLPEPSTANLNRFYTREFFGEVRSALTGSGVLALTLPASHGYIGRRLQAANGSVYRTLREVFPHVALTGEDYGGMFASPAPLVTDPEALAERFTSRAVATSFVHGLLFRDIFDPLRSDMVRSRLDQGGEINRDQRPVAYLYNLRVWAEMHGGSFLNALFDVSDRGSALVLSVLLAAAILLCWKKDRAVPYSLFTTGFATMGFSVLLMLAYQTACGALYERLGLLTALFMAGSALGAAAASRMRGSRGWLPVLDVASLLLFLAAPLLFTVEALYYPAMLACGAAGGAQFVLVTRAAAISGRQSAGTLYGLDLSGSTLGALLFALFVIPLFGMGSAILTLVAIKGSSLALLLSLGHAND